MMLFSGSTDTPLRESSADKLSLTHYAMGLTQFIEACQTPMTIGVQGEWGSGKTSLMSLVHAEIKKRTNDPKHPVFIDHWFDTWQYGAVGNADVLGMRLLEDLTRSIEQRGAEDNMAVLRAAQGMWRAARQLAPGVAKAVVAGGTTAATGGVVDGGTLVSSLPGGAGPVPIAEVKENFRKLVAAIVGQHTGKRKQGARVVVFIDDLDRIKPGRAVGLLEILKNFMDVEDTVFVVACDYDVVREGVRDLMGIEDPAKVNAFFHKIFQVPFEMPSASYTVAPMLRTWMEQKVGKNHGDEWTRKYAPMVEVALGTNPRAFKRFLNTVDLQCAVDAAYDLDGNKKTKAVQDWKCRYWVASLLGMFALQTLSPDVYGYLMYDCLREVNPVLATQRFERALRTLTGEWSGWTQNGAEQDEDTLEDPDEQLEAILRRGYGGPRLDDWKQHPDVEQLGEFASLWFAALDRQSAPEQGAGVLSADEVAYLWGWSQRLLSQRGSTRTRRGKWAFMEGARQADPASADAFLGLIDSVEQWSRNNPRLAPHYSRDGLFVKLEGLNGKAQNFICFRREKKKLQIKVRAARGQDLTFGLEGIEALGAQFTADIKALGFSTRDHYGFINIPFNAGGGRGHRDADKQQMDTLMILLKSLVDRTAQLETKKTTSEKVIEEAEAGEVVTAPPGPPDAGPQHV